MFAGGWDFSRRTAVVSRRWQLHTRRAVYSQESTSEGWVVCVWIPVQNSYHLDFRCHLYQWWRFRFWWISRTMWNMVFQLIWLPVIKLAWNIFFGLFIWSYIYSHILAYVQFAVQFALSKSSVAGRATIYYHQTEVRAWISNHSYCLMELNQTFLL